MRSKLIDRAFKVSSILFSLGLIAFFTYGVIEVSKESGPLSFEEIIPFAIIAMVFLITVWFLVRTWHFSSTDQNLIEELLIDDFNEADQVIRINYVVLVIAFLSGIANLFFFYKLITSHNYEISRFYKSWENFFWSFATILLFIVGFSIINRVILLWKLKTARNTNEFINE